MIALVPKSWGPVAGAMFLQEMKEASREMSERYLAGARAVFCPCADESRPIGIPFEHVQRCPLGALQVKL